MSLIYQDEANDFVKSKHVLPSKHAGLVDHIWSVFLSMCRLQIQSVPQLKEGHKTRPQERLAVWVIDR